MKFEVLLFYNQPNSTFYIVNLVFIDRLWKKNSPKHKKKNRWLLLAMQKTQVDDHLANTQSRHR